MAQSPQTFEEFIKLHPGVRNPSNLLAAWQRLQQSRREKQLAQSSGQALPGAPDPKFVPGALDEIAQADVGSLRHQRDTAMADAELNYQEAVAGLNSQLPLIEQSRKEGLRSTDQSHAARGTFRSGLRAVDRGRVENEALRSRTQVTDQIAQAAARRAAAQQAATGGYTTGYNRLRAQSNARAFSDWASRVTPPAQAVEAAKPPGPTRQPTQPAAQKRAKPEMDYRKFVRLHGGRSTAALAAAWKKRFGGG